MLGLAIGAGSELRVFDLAGNTKTMGAPFLRVFAEEETGLDRTFPSFSAVEIGERPVCPAFVRLSRFC